MNLISFLSLLTLTAIYIDNVSAFDQEQLEIFDLVEEINQNFYTVLKVEQVILDWNWLFCSVQIHLKYLPIDCRPHHQPKYEKHSVSYRLCYIRIRMMLKMPMYSFEILYQCMRCSRIHQNGQSRCNWINGINSIENLCLPHVHSSNFFFSRIDTIKCSWMDYQIGDLRCTITDAIVKWA